MKRNLSIEVSTATILFIMFIMFSQPLVAQSTQVEGFIKSRNRDIIILQSAGSPNLEVLLTDSTRVGQVKGVLKARKKDMSMAVLVPGLAIKVEGNYNEKNQLVAQSISFKGDDLKQA